MYYYYPFVYSEAFNYTDYEKIKTLCLASYLYYNSILLIDKVTDNQTKNIQEFLLMAHAFQNESITILQKLFFPDSEFWKFFRRRNNEWHKSYTLEKELDTTATISDYQKLVSAKTSVGKLAIDSIYILSNGSVCIYESLIEMYDLFYFAFQIQDDISDFDEDSINGQFNIAKNITSCLVTDNKLSEQVSNKTLFYLYIFEDLIKQAINQLDKGSDIAKNIQISFFENRIIALRNLLYNKLEIWSNYIHEQKIKNKIISQIDSQDKEAIKPFLFIIKEWQKNYPELKHKMTFPVNQRFISHPNQIGDVFQRAIITSHLIPLLPFLNPEFNIEKIIDFEKEYLISQKYGDTGWKYFPTLVELPADSDDLAQIIQVFYESDSNKIDFLFEKPVENLIKSLKDKIFPTWIISNQFHEIELKNINMKWGDTLDLCVIANIGYSLTLIKDKCSVLKNYNLENIFEENAKYLINKQNSNKLWDTTWYESQFYGTYVVIRFLYSINKFHEVIAITKQSIMGNQNNDGSFGTNSNAGLDTALSILCLLIGNPNIQEHGSIKRGVSFLKSIMNDNGMFLSSNFIKMHMGRAHGTVHNTIYYKSNTLTTSYCMLAILLYEQYNA